RQGTARLAARLQQDAERTKIRGLVYHYALSKALTGTNTGNQQLLSEITRLEDILANSEVPESARAPIREMLEEKRRLRADQRSPEAISFRELRAAIAQESHEVRNILHTYQQYSQSVFGGHDGASNLSGLLLVRELGRRPKRQNNLESMGMI